jgi:hypothetical protein
MLENGFTAQKKKIIEFVIDGSISDTGIQAIEMVKIYLMQRISYCKSFN